MFTLSTQIPFSCEGGGGADKTKPEEAYVNWKSRMLKRLITSVFVIQVLANKNRCAATSFWPDTCSTLNRQTTFSFDLQHLLLVEFSVHRYYP